MYNDHPAVCMHIWYIKETMYSQDQVTTPIVASYSSQLSGKDARYVEREDMWNVVW